MKHKILQIGSFLTLALLIGISACQNIALTGSPTQTLSTPITQNSPSPKITPTVTPVPRHIPTATLPPFDFLNTLPAPLAENLLLAPPPLILYKQPLDSALPNYLRLASRLLTLTHGNSEDFIRHVQSWGEMHSYVPGGAIWAQRIDLDGDGQAEILSSLPLLQEQPTTDTPGYTGILCLQPANCPRMVVVFRPQGEEFIPSALVIVDGSPWLQAPQLLAVDDLDGDGKPEVALKLTTLGMRNSNQILFGRWDGKAWQSLPGSADLLRGNFSQVKFTPKSGLAGKRVEVTLDPPGVLWVHARPHTRIYDWQKNGQLQEIEDIPAPSADPYFLLVDAHTALKRGQIDLGLELALQVLASRAQTGIEMERILSLAGIDAMLAYAQKNDPASMQRVLDEIHSNFSTDSNPYPMAAQKLIDTYALTHDAHLACQEMSAVVRYNWKEASLLPPSVSTTDPITEICPFNQNEP